MLLTCEGKFLGLVEIDASYTAKKGENAGQRVERTNREISVMTAKGPGTISVPPRAWEALETKLRSLKPFESEVIVAVEVQITSEYVQYEKVARAEFAVTDVEVIGAAAPRGNGSRAASTAAAE